jgi:hypothetical protein
MSIVFMTPSNSLSNPEEIELAGAANPPGSVEHDVLPGVRQPSGNP